MERWLEATERRSREEEGKDVVAVGGGEDTGTQQLASRQPNKDGWKVREPQNRGDNKGSEVVTGELSSFCGRFKDNLART